MIHARSLLGWPFEASTVEDLLIAAERLGLNCFEIENGLRRGRVVLLGREWVARDKTAHWRPILAAPAKTLPG
jgi:hypothetical protein